MNKKSVYFGVTVGLIAASVLYLAKKTGFFEDDRHLYDEFESR
ncbi:methanol dehydrogenase [Loigolactobacillus binensis]|uniref:Methanol dehydrogenase n=1 Tax=Loigolactobacillus binensis TaxID=2559922 RepID=A0ABW3EC97_9LACO|nr:methanol dehydrogenase [Loigolactobacillus binensis]